VDEVLGTHRQEVIEAAEESLPAVANEAQALAEETTTFFRGTTFGSASEVVENQALDIERIAANQAANPGAARAGVYLTQQEATASYYADLVGGGGRGLGPGVIRIEVPTQAFQAFAEKYGVEVETAVPNPPQPGQTETLIPFDLAKEFDEMASYFMHGDM